MKEFYTAKAVYDLGVPTPKVVEIESKVSFARLAGENPDSIDSLAAGRLQLQPAQRRVFLRQEVEITRRSSLFWPVFEDEKVILALSSLFKAVFKDEKVVTKVEECPLEMNGKCLIR